jgi:hypothetical protein
MMAMQRRHVLGGLGAVGAGLAGSFAPFGPTTVRAATSTTPLKAAATTNNGKPVVELRATSFGVRPGLTGDQSAPLLQLRNAITADRSRHYRVIFDKGAYRYSNNRWLLNVGSVTLEGNGSTFACISDSVACQNSRPLNLNSIFQELGDQPWPNGLRYNGGYRIKTANAGSTMVQLATPGDAARFVVGSRVLVHSFDHQWGGYPPNLRFFEWRKVTAVDRAKGLLTLDGRLVFAHDATLRDTVLDAGQGFALGQARVLPLERATFRYPELVELVDVHFLRNPTQPASAANGLAIAADTLIMRGCSHMGFLWPTENRQATYESCSFEHTEIDKMCGQVVFRGCAFTNPVVAGAGAHDVVIDGSTVKGFIAISPRRARILNTTIETTADDPWGAIRCYYDSFPVQLLECSGNTVVHKGPLHFAINGGVSQALTVSARGTSNEILLEDTSFNREQVIQRLIVGARLRLRNSTLLGTVTGIGWTGRQWRLQGSWTTQVAAGQVWELTNVQAIRESGTRFVGGDTAVVRAILPTQTLTTGNAAASG